MKENIFMKKNNSYLNSREDKLNLTQCWVLISMLDIVLTITISDSKKNFNFSQNPLFINLRMWDNLFFKDF